MPTRLRVIVADDHPLYRQGIVRALESWGTFEVTAQASDGATALALIRRHEPDVALLDVRMPGMDGIDVDRCARALRPAGPGRAAVRLRRRAARRGRAGGRRGRLRRPRPPTATSSAGTSPRQPCAHEARSPSAIHGSADIGRGRPPGWTPRLTSREHGLLRLARAGWDKPELAFLTGVDEPTLRRRLDSIMAKLGADDLAEAVRIALDANIIR